MAQKQPDPDPRGHFPLRDGAGAKAAGSAGAPPNGGGGQTFRSSVAAIRIVRRGILQAEEKYLIEPGASLGTWFARVQEPICVGTRVTLGRLEEGRSLWEAEVAGEQLGLQADVCAEAIRALAQLSPGGPSPEAREQVLYFVARRFALPTVVGIPDLLVVLARCTAALEPLANGLRDGDLPMGPPTDRDAVEEPLLTVAKQAFGAVNGLC